MNKEKKKKGSGKWKKSFSSQQFKSGAYSSVITVLVIAFVVVINLVFGKLDLSTDLSSGKLFTLSKETQNVVKDAEDKITIYYMVQEGKEVDYIDRVIKQYDKISDQVKVVKKDPVVYPGFAEQYVDAEVSSNDVIVVDETTGAAKYISNGDMYYQTSDYYSSSTLQYLDVEGRVTSAIQSVLSGDETSIYVVSGHEELEMSDSLKTSLEKMNVSIKDDFDLLTSKTIPSDCDILLLNGVKTDLRDNEKEMVLDYLKKGGKAIISLSYSGKDTPNMNEILDYYGISVDKGIIYEGTGHFVNYVNWIVPTANTESKVMESVGDNDYVVMADAQAFIKPENSALRSSVTITDLLTTSDKSYLKKDPTSGKAEKTKDDKEGPFQTGLYIEEELEDDNKTEIALYSSADADEALIKNAAGALIGTNVEESSIDAKNLSYSTVYMGVGMQIFWAVVIIILVPLVLLVAGFVIWFVRRRK